MALMRSDGDWLGRTANPIRKADRAAPAVVERGGGAWTGEWIGKYSDDQARDENGKWSAEGLASHIASPSAAGGHGSVKNGNADTHALLHSRPSGHDHAVIPEGPHRHQGAGYDSPAQAHAGAGRELHDHGTLADGRVASKLGHFHTATGRLVADPGGLDHANHVTDGGRGFNTGDHTDRFNRTSTARAIGHLEGAHGMPEGHIDAKGQNAMAFAQEAHTLHHDSASFNWSDKKGPAK